MNHIINEKGKSKEDLFNLNSMNINVELLYLKNEMLKEIKDMEKKLNNKLEITNNVYNEKMNECNEKLIKLTNLIIDDNNLKEKVNELIKTKTTFKDSLLAYDKQLNTLDRNFKKKITEINKILSETVIYPKVIGGINKIKTFHEFIDYVLNQIDKSNSFNEKHMINLDNNKKQLENFIKNQQSQLDKVTKSTNELITKTVNSLENKIINILPLCDEKIQSFKAENQQYISIMEQYNKDLTEELKRFHMIKNNIYNRFNNDIYNIKKENQQVVKTFGNYKNELNVLKEKFSKLSEFIKDIRFRKNLGDLKKKYFLGVASELDFTKKNDIPSKFKKYIQGEMGSDESNSAKKFSNTNYNFYNDKEFIKGSEDFINSYNLKKNLYFGYNKTINDHNLKTSNINKKIEYSNNFKKKSVFNSVNPFFFQDYKNILSNKKIFDNSLDKKEKSNEDIKNLDYNYKMSVNRLSESSEIAGRKTIPNLANNENIISKINNNINLVKLNDNDSEIKNNIQNSNQNNNYNNQKEIIKEEEEDSHNIIKKIN